MEHELAAGAAHGHGEAELVLRRTHLTAATAASLSLGGPLSTREHGGGGEGCCPAGPQRFSTSRQQTQGRTTTEKTNGGWERCSLKGGSLPGGREGDSRENGWKGEVKESCESRALEVGEGHRTSKHENEMRGSI